MTKLELARHCKSMKTCEYCLFPKQCLELFPDRDGLSILPEDYLHELEQEEQQWQKRKS